MLRLGIAGIGAIAGDYIGLIVGGKVRDVALTALCSRNEAHIREAAQRHGLQAAAFTDYGAMLRSGQVDAILICTPHAQHPEMTRQALEAGLHVLVEKPVGIFADEVAFYTDGDDETFQSDNIIIIRNSFQAVDYCKIIIYIVQCMLTVLKVFISIGLMFSFSIFFSFFLFAKLVNKAENGMS